MASGNKFECRVLVIEYNSSELFHVFKSWDYIATHSQVPEHVIWYLRNQEFDMVVIIGLLNSTIDKFDILDDVLPNTKLPVIMISDDEESAMEVFRRGCCHCYPYPIGVNIVGVMFPHMFKRTVTDEEVVDEADNRPKSAEATISRHSICSHLRELSINNNVQNINQHQNPGSVRPQDFLSAWINSESNIHVETRHHNPNTNNLQAENNNSKALVINDQIHGFNNYQSSNPVPSNRDDINNDFSIVEDRFANDQA